MAAWSTPRRMRCARPGDCRKIAELHPVRCQHRPETVAVIIDHVDRTRARDDSAMTLSLPRDDENVPENRRPSCLVDRHRERNAGQPRLRRLLSSVMRIATSHDDPIRSRRSKCRADRGSRSRLWQARRRARQALISRQASTRLTSSRLGATSESPPMVARTPYHAAAPAEQDSRGAKPSHGLNLVAAISRIFRECRKTAQEFVRNASR